MTISIERLLSGSATVDWVNPAMTGTTKQVTEPIELADRARDCSWAPAWEDATGVTGLFGVELSNDLVKWTPGVLDTDFSTIGSAPAADDDTQRVQGSFRARYALLTYTNATNTGTLTQGVHVNGKRGNRRASGKSLEARIKAIARDNLIVLHLATDFTPGGTDPDVAIGPNLARTDTLYDIINATESQRPHAVTRPAGKAWAHDTAALQHLHVDNAVSDILDANDDPTFFVVGKADSGPGGSGGGVFSLGAGLTSQGLDMFITATSLTVVGLMTTGASTATTAYTDYTNVRLWRATMRGNAHPSPGVVLAIDEVEQLAARNSPGLSVAADTAYMGKRPSNAAYFDGDIYAIVGIRAYDSDMIDALAALLQSEFGTP